MDAIKEHSYDQFIYVLEESKKYRLPRKIRTAFNTLYHYRHNIQNSLTYTLSNGCVEGTNNKIKVIKRISYGYRNFYHLRSRIILSTAHNKVKNEAYRPLLFTEEDAIKKYEEEYQTQLEMQNEYCLKIDPPLPILAPVNPQIDPGVPYKVQRKIKRLIQ